MFPRKVAINNFWRTSGIKPIMAKLDAFYMFAAADSQAALLNWIQNLYNAVATSSPTFTVDRDYQGDALASYLETNFNPTTAVSPKFTLNSACLGVYSRTDITDSQQFDIGNTTARFNSRSTIGPAFRGPMNDATSFVASPMNNNSLGLFALNRSGASARQGYINGASVGSDTQAATALSNETIQILRGTFNFSSRKIACAFFGQSLTAQEHATLFAAINT